MTDSFNLTREGWLPVIMKDGTFRDVSFREAFEQAHLIRDITVRNRVERLAILHILVALNLRAYPNWDGTWERGSFDPSGINDYLDKHEGRFDLLGDTPFLQVKSVAALIGKETPYLAPGHMFLSKHVTSKVMSFNEDMSLKDAVTALISQYTYTQTGTMAGVGGSGSVSFSWHSTGFTAIGDSLFSTIMLNTVDCQWEDSSYETDLPVWERDTKITPGEPRMPKGIADYLTYPHRAIELKIEEDRVVGFKLAQGEKWKSESTEEIIGVDPFRIFSLNKKGLYSTDNFRTRSVASYKERKKTFYVPSGLLGGLFSLYDPRENSRSLVRDRVDGLSTHTERFVGYEVAILIVDASMGTLVDDLIEEGLRIPYQLENNPELNSEAWEVMQEVFALQHQYEKGLNALLPGKLLVEANSSLNHFLNQEMRKYISNGAKEEKEELLRRVASRMVDEFDIWTRRIPVKKWEENHRATWGFTKSANNYLRKEKDAE